MKRPLVPVDGSEEALRALAHALAELRDTPGGQLHVLNVQPTPIHPWPGKLVPPDLIEQELRHEAERIMQPAEAAARVGTPSDQMLPGSEPTRNDGAGRTITFHSAL